VPHPDRTTHRVLTVCLGNICRSPTAEAAIVEAAAARGVEVEVSSAGTGGWHVGDPPDARMRAAGADVDLIIDGAAAQVTPDALRDADLVVAMDRSNLADLRRLAEDHGITTPIRLYRAFDDDSLAADDLEVPDPYYGGSDGFAHVVALCRAAAVGVVEHLAGRRADPGER
jgi:protein-tyrosine phosphatase